VGAEAVGEDGRAVAGGIDHEAESPVHDGVEGAIVGADAVGAGELGDGFRIQNPVAVSFAAVEEGFVEPGEFADGAASVSGGETGRDGFARVDGDFLYAAAEGVEDREDAGFVRVVDGAGHADPGLGHAERLEDGLADIAVERPAVDAAEEVAEYVPTGLVVVAGGLADDPAVFKGRGTYLGDGGVPVRLVKTEVDVGEAGGVGQEMAGGDGAFAVLGEFGDGLRYGGVEIEFAAFPELCDGERGGGLGCGEPEGPLVGGDGIGIRVGRAVADAFVGDYGAVEGDVELCAEVEALFDARVDCRSGSIEGWH